MKEKKLLFKKNLKKLKSQYSLPTTLTSLYKLYTTLLPILLIFNHQIQTSSSTPQKFQAIWYLNFSSGGNHTIKMKFFNSLSELEAFTVPNESLAYIKRTEEETLLEETASEITDGNIFLNALPSINGNHPRYFLVYKHVGLSDDGVFTFSMWTFSCLIEAEEMYEILTSDIFATVALYSPYKKIMPDEVVYDGRYYFLFEEKAVGVCTSTKTEVKLNNLILPKMHNINTGIKTTSYNQKFLRNYSVFNTRENKHSFQEKIRKLILLSEVPLCSTVEPQCSDNKMRFKLPYKTMFNTIAFASNGRDFVLNYDESGVTGEFDSSNYINGVYDYFFCFDGVLDLNDISNVNVIRRIKFPRQ